MKKHALHRSLFCLLLVACLLPLGSCTRFQQNVNLEDDSSGEVLPAFDIYYYGESMAQGNVAYVYARLKESVACTVPATKIPLDPSQNVTKEDLHDAICMFISDRPDCFWFQKDYTFSTQGDAVVELCPTYCFEQAQLETVREELDEALEEILQGVSKTDLTDRTYETALYLHDELAKRVEYEETGYHQNAYGALVDGKAVCAGYAAAYQLLLQKAGIPSYTVIGTGIDPADESGTAVAHAWNAVWMTETDCVFTDVTWNDAPEHIFHYYFNRTFEEMERDHTANPDSFPVVSCGHEGYDYLAKNPSLEVSSATTAKQFADLFYQIDSQTYKTVVFYNDEQPFSTWFDRIHTDLFREISHLETYSASVGQSHIGNEYQIQIKFK